MTPNQHTHWQGTFVAAVTPLTDDNQPDATILPTLLDFYAEQGCDGVLLFGTTGEGPSFSARERMAMIQAAGDYRSTHPELKILVGVGSPNLDDTLTLTQASYGAGLDGVLCLPPYFFKNPSPMGLSDYYSQVIEQGVPAKRGGFFFYHIPQVAGVGVPYETIETVLARYPEQVAGIKDSSGDLAHAASLCAQFPALRVFIGSPTILADGLQAGAAGSITALANVYASGLRRLEMAFRTGGDVQSENAAVLAVNQALAADPTIPGLKLAMHRHFGLPLWGVRLPLRALEDFEPLAMDAVLGN